MSRILVLLLIAAAMLLVGCEPADPRYTVSGWVWVDENGNGVQDPGETGAQGVLVEHQQISDSNAISFSWVRTVNGTYQFSWTNDAGDNGPEEFLINIHLPEGYRFTLKDQGADDVNSDVDPESGTTQIFSIESGVHVENIDAGLVPIDVGGEPEPSAQPSATPGAAKPVGPGG